MFNGLQFDAIKWRVATAAAIATIGLTTFASSASAMQDPYGKGDPTEQTTRKQIFHKHAQKAPKALAHAARSSWS